VEKDSPQGSAFPLRKGGDPKLPADLDAQIDAMIDDGTYVTLYRKYFKDPIAAALLQERPKLAAKIQGTDLASPKRRTRSSGLCNYCSRREGLVAPYSADRLSYVDSLKVAERTVVIT
jgi:hypothetical protein